MLYRYCVLLVFLIVCQNSLNSQSRKISTFDLNDPTNAVLRAFKSEFDTLIFDSYYSIWELKPIRLVGIKGKTIFFEPGIEIKAKKKAFPKKTDALFKFIGNMCKVNSFFQWF